VDFTRPYNVGLPNFGPFLSASQYLYSEGQSQQTSHYTKGTLRLDSTYETQERKGTLPMKILAAKVRLVVVRFLQQYEATKLNLTEKQQSKTAALFERIERERP
jgi:hypothetical protein